MSDKIYRSDDTGVTSKVNHLPSLRYSPLANSLKIDAEEFWR